MEQSYFQSKLNKYIQIPKLFSKMENSTCTVEGSYLNVKHNEKNLMTFLECDDDIVSIDSNFGHLRLEGYQGPLRERKSNRGRKKKPKVIKLRKFQGDGSGFNSQISFTVLGAVKRPAAETPDKHSAGAEIREIDGVRHEIFIKEFKIKIFRNGKFTVPGVLTEDLSDVTPPLEKLASYFRELFLNDISIKDIFSVMRNYKFHVIGKKIDIKAMYKYFAGQLNSLLNTRFEDIREFIINPIAESGGWKEILSYHDNIFSFEKLRNYLEDSPNAKNLYIDFNKLTKYISDLPLNENYRIIRDLVNIDQKQLFFDINPSVFRSILNYLLEDELNNLNQKLHKSGKNILSHIKYDPEKYPGFLIKIKTPNANNPDKRTTIKVFPSGKINIDGANNKTEAQFIYYWLNYLFYTNPEFLY